MEYTSIPASSPVAIAAPVRPKAQIPAASASSAAGPLPTPSSPVASTVATPVTTPSVSLAPCPTVTGWVLPQT